MVSQLVDLKVSGGAGVSTKGEEKEFKVSFRSLGSGACLWMDFNDGTRSTYGDRYYCKLWKPDETHVNGVTVEKSMTVAHTYQ